MKSLRAILFLFLLTSLMLSFAQSQLNDPQKPFFPEGRPLEGLIITLDAGHGGSSSQPGYSGSARGVNSQVVEGDLNMLVAAELRWYLQMAGAKVNMTRWDDRKVTLCDTKRSEELGARPRMADATRSHIFLALHHNSAPRRTANGVVVLIWPTDSKGNDQPLETTLANILREEVEKQVESTEPFSLYLNEHPLVTDSDLPSAVVEFGFLSNPEFDDWVSQRGSHRAEALGVYNAIVRMWEENGEALEANRNKLFPKPSNFNDDDLSKPQPEWKARLAERTDISQPIKNLVMSLWPFDQPPKTSKDVNWIIDQYRRVRLSDATTFYLNVTAKTDDSGWMLKGKTNHPILRNAVANIMMALECAPLDVEVELLPSEQLGEMRFGVVQIPMALTWSEPRENSAVQTQLLLGELVFLLDESDDGNYLLLHGGDGYVGWVRKEAVLRLDEKSFGQWQENRNRSVTIIEDYLVDDFRLPAGAILTLIEDHDSTVTLQLPRGVRATGGKAEAVVPVNHIRKQFDPLLGETAARCAMEFLTTPYVFGGKSRIGLDCSGLTNTAWAAAGVALPRDARQQILVGRLTATSWAANQGLRRGDLVFFLDDTGKVYHVGLWLGNSRFIHASPPEVHVSSFDPADPLYNAEWRRMFAIARRPGGN